MKNPVDFSDITNIKYIIRVTMYQKTLIKHLTSAFRQTKFES